ncbi:MAG: hypothetical protein REH79_00965 [Spiroplasma sp.]|nr:hypothetical protein [Spiroplasma sp.]
MFFKINRRATFYIYLSALIMMICFLVIDLVTSIYFPSNITISLGYGERVSHYYAFFTTQSNYLVVLYFVYYLYTLYFNKTRPSFAIRLAVTVYISITMLVFWGGIFTQTQELIHYSIYTWINTTTLHLIMPIIMITSFVLTSGREQIAIKKWHHNHLWLIALYPVIYSVVILIRGYLKSLDNITPPNTWYPYYFFNFYQPYGWLIASAAVIVIFGLVFGLQYFYMWINNLMFKRSQNEKQQLELYYQKTLIKVNRQIKKSKYKP